MPNTSKQTKRKGVGAWLANAFTVPDAASERTPDDEAVLDRVAEWTVDRRVTAPMEFILECMRPVSFFTQQFMVAAEPLMFMASPITESAKRIFPDLKIFLKGDYTRFTRLLEHRGNIDLLLDKINAFENNHHDGKKKNTLPEDGE